MIILALSLPLPAMAQSQGANEGARAEAPSDVDNERVFDAFRALREMEKARRIGTSIATVSTGAGLAVVGVAVAPESKSWGTFLGLTGGLLVFSGGLSLMLPSPSEQLAREFDVDRTGPHSAAEAERLEQAWEERARKMKTMRFVGAGLGVGASAVELGLGIAFSAGAFSDVETVDEQLLGGILMGAGTAALVSSVSLFFLRSPMETSYDSFQQSEKRRRSFSLSLSPSPSGIGLGARGSF